MYDRTTPVLFLIFNRPDKTRQVFDEIKKARPQRLFVAADGPRASVAGEAEKCQATRDVIRQVNWECEVMTLYRDQNLGCGKAVSSAVDWFFEQVEEGVILEDDCLPDQSFFYFCQEMLKRYRDDTRVMHIGGSNFQRGEQVGDGDYYFSRLPHVWGWATWRRAWQRYDVTIHRFPAFEAQRTIEHVFPGQPAIWQRYLTGFRRIYQGEWDNWDPQWIFANFSNHALTILPNRNLISNIGFGEDATELGDKDHPAINRATEEISTLRPPSFMVPHTKADEYTLEKVFGKGPLERRVLRKLRQLTKS